MSEADIRQAGLAISKRAYAIYKANDYEATLLVAALRGIHHIVGLAGADMVISVHPSHRAAIMAYVVPRRVAIDEPVPPEVIALLRTIPELVHAYELHGMAVDEFLSFGATQKTLSQFDQVGWSVLESFDTT